MQLSANKHQQRTEATRRKLLAAARRIFARDGFEAARIEDIALEAGHTRGAFYANFKTKEDLFLALLEQETNEHMRRIEELLKACTDPEQRLEALREYYVKRAGNRTWVMLMLEFKLFAVRHGHIRAKLAGAHRQIRASLKLDRIDYLLPERVGARLEAGDARWAGLEAMLNGLVLERAYDPQRISEDQVCRMLQRIFKLLVESNRGAE